MAKHLHMKALDVRKKSASELKKLLGEKQAELRDFRFGMSAGQKKNIRRARSLRADIARIKTILSEANT